MFDLLETVRPLVEEWVLTLLGRHTFTRHDFTETRTGAVRILPPLSHQLADSCLVWARAAAPHAEQIAHLVAASSPYQIPTPTPLTASHNRSARGRKPWADRDRTFYAAMPAARCTECGDAECTGCQDAGCSPASTTSPAVRADTRSTSAVREHPGRTTDV